MRTQKLHDLQPWGLLALSKPGETVPVRPHGDGLSAPR